MPVIIVCMYMYRVLAFSGVLWLTSPFSILKSPVIYYPNDTEIADIRIAQGVMISLNSLEYTLSFSLSLWYVTVLCIKGMKE